MANQTLGMILYIDELIKEETERLNVLFQKGAEITNANIPLFTVKDYAFLAESQAYFGDFILPGFLSYAVFKDIEYRINTPYRSVAWYWKEDLDAKKTKDFLTVQTRLLYDTLKAFLLLFQGGNYFQSLIIFRSYIEYSSQFYAALLDYDFFKKYTGNELLDDDYKQLWFSTLKPAKVQTKIKHIHAEINQLLEEKKAFYSPTVIYWRIFRPFDSDLRGFLYGELSALAHGSYPALIKRDEVRLQALVWLCSSYLVESQTVINELTSVYFDYSNQEMFTKWVTIEVYRKCKEREVEIVQQTA